MHCIHGLGHGAMASGVLLAMDHGIPAFMAAVGCCFPLPGFVTVVVWLLVQDSAMHTRSLICAPKYGKERQAIGLPGGTLFLVSHWAICNFLHMIII